MMTRRIPDERSLLKHRAAMNPEEFQKFSAGEFGIYGGEGLGEGEAVPQGLTLIDPVGMELIPVDALGGNRKFVVLNFGSCS